MADLTITPASVQAGTTALKGAGVAGGTITAGSPLFKDTADSNYLKPGGANANVTFAAIEGIALHGASRGQPIAYAFDDSAFTPGATLVTGQVYAAAANVGNIAPVSDLSTGQFPTVLMVAKSNTQAVLKITRGGAAKA